MEHLLKYINAMPVDAQKAFAEACDTSINYLRKACSKGQKLGAELCIAIERESKGRVTCEQLRPDADWAYLRTTRQKSKKSEAA